MAYRNRSPARRKKDGTMSEGEVRALVESERADSLHSFQSSSLQNDRSKALDYYLGDMAEDMPSEPDRSTAVSTDVRDTIEGLMPSLMEIFASGDEVVRFDPVGPEDEEAAAQETDYVNHVFLHENPGWMVLYTFIKDALLSKVGVVKVWWGTELEEKRETYYDLTDEEFGLLASDDDLELVAHSERLSPLLSELTPEGSPSSPSGAVAGGEADASPPMLHDAIFARKKEVGRLKMVPVPPEEFGINRRAKSIQDASYIFHEAKTDPTELINNGYDRKQVEGLPTGDEYDDEERLARDTVQESDDQHLGSTNWSAREIRIVEHYIKMDYEGDGVARLYRVVTAGNGGEILRKDGRPDIELVDRFPFAAQTPVPITHRFFGLSVADLVLDIQRQKTALTRAMLNSIYLANNQRLEVAEEGATTNTIDDVLDNKPGGIVRTKRVGSIAPIPNTPIGDFTMPLVQYLDATREWRTGVTRQGQGIDADALQNQTAEAVSKVFTAAQARMRLMARIFAETGIRDLFSLVHETIRKNDDKANTVRLRNQWVAVDPRIWQRRKDMTITVGLGAGSREQQLQFLMALLNLQKEAMATGSDLVTQDHIYNTLKKIVEYAGMRSVEPYFADPEGKEYEPPPDPDVQKIEMEAKLKQQEAQQRAEIEKLQAQADIETERQKVASQIELERAKFEFQKQLKLLELRIKAQQGNGQGNGSTTLSDDEVEAMIDTSTGGSAGPSPFTQAVQAIQALAENMSRPKRIMRDETGKAVGIQ